MCHSVAPVSRIYTLAIETLELVSIAGLRTVLLIVITILDTVTSLGECQTLTIATPNSDYCPAVIKS